MVGISKSYCCVRGIAQNHWRLRKFSVTWVQCGEKKKSDAKNSENKSSKKWLKKKSVTVSRNKRRFWKKERKCVHKSQAKVRPCVLPMNVGVILCITQKIGPDLQRKRQNKCCLLSCLSTRAEKMMGVDIRAVRDWRVGTGDVCGNLL